MVTTLSRLAAYGAVNALHLASSVAQRNDNVANVAIQRHILSAYPAMTSASDVANVNQPAVVIAAMYQRVTHQLTQLSAAAPYCQLNVLPAISN